jgi:hypothetical protein
MSDIENKKERRTLRTLKGVISEQKSVKNKRTNTTATTMNNNKEEEKI